MGDETLPLVGRIPLTEQQSEALDIVSILDGSAAADLAELGWRTLERFHWLVGSEVAALEQALHGSLRQYHEGLTAAVAAPSPLAPGAIASAAPGFVGSRAALQLRREIDRADAVLAAYEDAADAAEDAAAAERAAAAQAATPRADAQHLARAAAWERIAQRLAALAEAAAAERARLERRLAHLERPTPPPLRPRRVTYCATTATPRSAPIAAHAPPTRSPRDRSTTTVV